LGETVVLFQKMDSAKAKVRDVAEKEDARELTAKKGFGVWRSGTERQ
jgi:hypothetical protein